LAPEQNGAHQLFRFDGGPAKLQTLAHGDALGGGYQRRLRLVNLSRAAIFRYSSGRQLEITHTQGGHANPLVVAVKDQKVKKWQEVVAWPGRSDRVSQQWLLEFVMGW
jgi:hypothetical protein